MPEKVDKSKKGTGLEPNIAGALSYVLGWITGLILLLIEKEDDFVRFHAMQSVILSIVFFATWIVLIITLIGMLLLPFVGLGYFLLTLFLIYKAYLGEKYMLPTLGDYAEQYAKQLKK